MFSLSFPVACLIALLLGAVCVLGFAPYGLWFVPIVAFAGWFLLLLRFTARRSRLGLAACFGFAYFFVGVGWLYISLNHYGGVPALFAVLAVGLFAAYLALFPLVAVYFASHLQVSRVYWLLLVLPAGYGLGEWLRGWLFSGFPWLAVGYAQIPGGWLAGYAPVLGIYGVGYLSLLSAGGFACLFASGVAPRHRIAVVVLLVAVWGIGGALQQISWTEAVGKPISVALLQGNVPQDRKWQEEALQETFARYRQLILASSQQLIVLPETALPVFMHDLPAEFLEQIAQHARKQGADILLGVPSLTADGQQYYNSVVSLGVSPMQTFRKMHLVPFGEFIPFKALLGGVYQSLNIPLTDFASGPADQTYMQVAGQRLLVNICYEDVFGEELLARVPESTILLNVTNDAWYDQSPAAHQHLQIAQARAAETGRYLLRATNTGMTAIIDQRGYIAKLAPWFQTLALTGEALGYQGVTPYVRVGNVPIVVWMFISCLFLWRRSVAEQSAVAQ